MWCFAEAKNGNYVNIDESIMKHTYNFMLSSAVVDSQGSVSENGNVIHSEMQVSLPKSAAHSMDDMFWRDLSVA